LNHPLPLAKPVCYLFVDKRNSGNNDTGIQPKNIAAVIASRH
jgi:hypothetical protein